MTVCDYVPLLRAGSASDRWLGPALVLGARIGGAGLRTAVELQTGVVPARNHQRQVHRTWTTPLRAMVIE
jgi:hypothetical protein